jgi:SprT protein
MKIKHKAIQARAFEFLKVAEAHYGRSFREPIIYTDLRGRVAGQAFYYQNKIRLNGGLMDKYPERMMEQTLPHEIAHLVVHEVYGRANVKPHGSEWKNCMRVLGCDPKTRHNMNTDGCGGGRWARDNIYVCGDNCVEHPLTNVRHKKIQSGRTSFTCKKCGEMLRLKGTKRDPGLESQSGLIDDFPFADQWGVPGLPKAASAPKKPKGRLTRKPIPKAKKANGTWNPKAGSKGAAALKIYRKFPGISGDSIIVELMAGMNIKKSNARQYLKLCKTAKVI